MILLLGWGVVMGLGVLDSWGGTDMICGVENRENCYSSLVAKENEGRAGG